MVCCTATGADDDYEITGACQINGGGFVYVIDIVTLVTIVVVDFHLEAAGAGSDAQSDAAKPQYS